jgi:hypothetical protein
MIHLAPTLSPPFATQKCISPHQLPTLADSAESPAARRFKIHRHYYLCTIFQISDSPELSIPNKPNIP